MARGRLPCNNALEGRRCNPSSADTKTRRTPERKGLCDSCHENGQRPGPAGLVPPASRQQDREAASRQHGGQGGLSEDWAQGFRVGCMMNMGD